MQNDAHLLICYLIALANYAKDFHYYCKSFGEHLFADVVYDDLYDITDTIRESVILSAGELPLSSKKYLAIAANLVPEITEDDHTNLIRLFAFLSQGKLMINAMEGTRGENAILDEIAGHIDKACGLTFLQMRKYNPVQEGIQEGYSVEHCKACVQKDIDRAKAEIAKIDYDKVAKTVRDYEDKTVLVAEESTLDKLERKLGI